MMQSLILRRSYDLVNELEALKPFGVGNPSPTFLLSDASMVEYNQVGGHGKHLKVSVGLGKGFGMASPLVWGSVPNPCQLPIGCQLLQDWRKMSGEA